MEDFDSSLLPKSGYLPTQWDRQVDEFDSPGISAGGASLPFQIVDASTGGGTPAANIKVLFGTFYSPTLGTTIDVTLGGTSLTLGPTLNFGGAGTYKVYLDTDLSTFCTVQSTTGAVPSDNSVTPETYMLLGVVTVVTSGSGLAVGTIQQGVTGAFSAVLCSNALNFMWSTL